MAMFSSYLKIALRNIKRDKSYSFINAAGLAVGITCFILIFLWIQTELNYDGFHENEASLYRVNMERHRATDINVYDHTSFRLGPALKENFPEIRHFARTYSEKVMVVGYGIKSFRERKFCFTDPEFFKMFTFPFIKGDPETALADPLSIVLTENMAEKYFGSEEPMGKRLMLGNLKEFVVTGVLKNIPHNSHFQYDFFAQNEFAKELGGAHLTWRTQDFYTFILLREGISPGEMEPKMDEWVKGLTRGSSKLLLKLQRIGDIHLYPLNQPAKVVELIYIFSLIAVFIIIIACVNFMNLATARSGRRMREVGVRKTFGAKRWNLIRQFFGETLALSFISLIIAILLVLLLLPVFNSLTGSDLSFNPFANIGITLALIVITIFTGLLSGSYPAFFLSSFQPIVVLGNRGKMHTKSGWVRKTLVVFQFSLSVVLIIATAGVYSQLNYIKNRDMGYEKNNIIYIPLSGGESKDYEVIKNELSKNPDILHATFTNTLPNNVDSGAGALTWEGKAAADEVEFYFVAVDFDYIDTFGMKIVKGRNFSRDFPADVSNYIVNEEAVRQMGMEDPIGKRLTMWDLTGEIVGVVKDFNFLPLREKIQPLLLTPSQQEFIGYLVVRVKGDNIPGSLDYLKNLWNRFNAKYPFEYRFLDEDFERFYTAEQRLGRISGYFSVLAVFISCLGLLGLVSYVTGQRSKEIGIRKVLGASVRNIVQLLLNEFVVLVILSNIIAWPIAYLAISKWLENFAYRAGIDLSLFFFSSILTLLIALLTVMYVAVRAALGNPVDAIKWE